MRSLLLFLLLVPADDFEKARTALRKAFREGKPEEQRDAVRGMAKFDRVDAVELLVEAWHDSEVRLRNGGDADLEAKMRRALAETLAVYRDKMAVRYLARQLRENDSAALREVAAAIAAKTGGEEMKAALAACVGREKSALVLAAALRSLQAIAPAESRAVFVEKLNHPHWRIRREAMRGVRECDAVEAVASLIGLLREDALWAEEINQTLVHLTGVDKRASFEGWREWWEAGGREIEKKRPPLQERLAAVETSKKSASTQPTFYGVRVVSKRVIFVVDLSGSMEGKAEWTQEGEKAPKAVMRKIDVARWELKRAIEHLPADGTFNVMTYEKKVKRFADGMAANTKEKRDEALAWMEEWATEGGTDTWGGLNEALGVAGVTRAALAADTIYLITDGKPTFGTAEWILGKVRDRNEAGKVVIHCIGVGRDVDAEFLERLAEENGGAYIPR